jgi:hypothetical protein
MGPGTKLASNCFGVDSGGDAAARRSRGYGPEGRTAALTLPLGIDRGQDGTRCPNLFKTADYPLLVTGDLEVGKPETTRIKSRRIAISSTKWRNIPVTLTDKGLADCLESVTSDRFIWCAPLLLGVMFVYSAVSCPKPGARWYGRVTVGVLGAYLLYISAFHVFPLHR